MGDSFDIILSNENLMELSRGILDKFKWSVAKFGPVEKKVVKRAQKSHK